MAKSNKGFCLFYDWMDSLDELDPADAYAVIRAISRYNETGEDPTTGFKGALKAFVMNLYQQIKRAEETSAAKAEGARITNEKRANAERADSERIANAERTDECATNTNTITDTYTDTNTDTSISSNEDKKRKRFVAPTIDEVRDYCNENGYRIDAEAFVDHYQSVGWKVGNKPMRDWKAAVRTWVRRDKERMPKKQTESSFDDTFMLSALKRVYGEAGA